MADRQAGDARARKPARGRGGGGPRSNPRRPRLDLESFLRSITPFRPPCSVAERELADVVGRRLRDLGLSGAVEAFRAPTSPTWPLLLRALLRVWAAAFLAAGWTTLAASFGGAAILGGIPMVGGAIRFLPPLGSRSHNVVALQRGTDPRARPVVVVAHLDTHAAAGTPMGRAHAFLAAISGFLVLGSSFIGRPGGSLHWGWRPVAAVVAFECVITMGWLAWRELETPKQPPDDNTSGVIALIRAAELIADDPPTHDVWFVGTGAGTSGSYGLIAFLKGRPELKTAWVVEIDALGRGEVLASPLSARIPAPGTPPALTRAVMAAARASGDPLATRRVYRPHSDARAALRRRVGAIVLTGGIRPPMRSAAVADLSGPDPANAERAARIVSKLARSDP